MNDATVRPLPFIDLKAQQAVIRERVEARIKAVLDHGQYINGPEVKELEAALAGFADCRHAIGVSSGTDALLIALMAMDVGPGDAVFLPGFTFPATAEVVAALGAAPVFVDVEEATCNIDVGDLERQIERVKAEGTYRARAIMPVDLYGLPADYAAINALAARHDLDVVADAAQSFGGGVDNRRVGTLARVTCTSFFPAKPLGCYGDGGAVFTDDDGLADVMRSIRMHGQGSHKYDIVRIGVNGRLDTMQAAVLLEKLAIFADEIAAREKLARRFDAALAGAVTLIPRPERVQSAHAQYTILVDERDAVAARLKAEGVPTQIYYPKPLFDQPPYAAFRPEGAENSVSARLADRALSLPFHPYMDEATADRVCAAVRAALEV